jgi:hypothetical protein
VDVEDPLDKAFVADELEDLDLDHSTNSNK